MAEKGSSIVYHCGNQTTIREYLSSAGRLQPARSRSNRI